MYEIYAKLRDEKGVKDATVAKATGIGKSTFSDWKNGRSVPKDEKLQKIAEYFGVSAHYLRTGKKLYTATFSTNALMAALDTAIAETGAENPQQHEYYNDPETAEIAQELFTNRDLRALLDAARGNSPENLKLATEMLARMKGTNPDG